MTDDEEIVYKLLACATFAWSKGDKRMFSLAIDGLHKEFVLGQQGSLPGIDAVGSKVSSHDQALRVFAYWRSRCDHAGAKPTDERIAKVVARLRDGYTEAEIKKAIDGAAADPFVKDGVKYDDLELICRNGSKLEAFMARGEKATGTAAVDEAGADPLEQEIAAARDRVRALLRQGRTTEYERANTELAELMKRRGRK
jgi:hypothetical protein